MNQNKIENVIAEFALVGALKSCTPYGSGHINDTYLVDMQQKRYILQKINTHVFSNAKALMQNISQITQFLKQKIVEAGGDPYRETLNLVPTQQGTYYFQDHDHCFWRCYDFIEDSISYDIVRAPEDFYQCGIAFGHFQSLLADFPAKILFETIPNFHNTPLRYQTFLQAVSADSHQRADEASEEISFIRQRAGELSELTDSLKQGKLPLRVTHNDTKLNNCLFDRRSRKAICVIDLDTVMPGLVAYDFGDSIRFGASTAAEDEPDLKKVHFSLPLYESYTKGFLEAAGKSLTSEELCSLPVGAKLMTLECGIRFLTDYLEGDVYFKISHEKHNLERCRTQLKLVSEMESKWNEMNDIIYKYK